jgi:hypothetical protein
MIAKEFVLLEQIAKQIIKTCSSSHFKNSINYKKNPINQSTNPSIIYYDYYYYCYYYLNLFIYVSICLMH